MSLNPMSFNIGGIGSWVTRQIARPTPPETVAKWMNRVSHPSAENILPTMALESGVISGRSIYAWTRSGLLETQERFFEEASVAALWFWGVAWMEKAFDKTLQCVGPKSLKALDPGIGWAVKDGSLRLNPLESHMPNAQAAEKLLYLKSSRLFFSVASSIALVALAVPWINQKKTEWIIDKYFKKNHDPAPTFSGTLPLPKLSIQRPSGFSPFLPHPPFNNTPGSLGNTALNTINKSPSTNAPGGSNHPHFSGLPGINQIGHWVQDTDLGKLFAIDTGIFAGRTYTAAKRSRFESIEIGLRDLSSYYFYFLAVPHCFKVLNFIAEKTIKGNILLEPQVAETLLKRIQEKSKEWKTSLQFGKPELDKFLYGQRPESLGSPEALSKLKQTLMSELRTAHPSKFIHHLKPALEALHPNPAKQAALLETILDALNSSDTPLGRGIQGDSLQGLIEKIESGALQKGEASNAINPLGQLSKYEKKDLTVALKQAFHHSTGLTQEECLKLPEMKTLKQTLPQKEWEALEKRMSVLLERDTTEQALNLLQRIRLLVNPILEKLPESQTILNALETLSKQLNQAHRRAIPLEQKIPQEMKNLMGALKSTLFKPSVATAQPALTETQRKTFEYLENTLDELFTYPTQQRIYGLELGEASKPMLEKLDELLLGGLVRDTEFLQEGVRLSGYLVEDTKQWMSPHRKATLKQEVEKYLKSFMKRVEASPTENILRPHLTPQWLEKELDAFYRLSRNTRYGANLFAILFGIFGLSFLIPKVQYWMTKTLTGKNEHPGIAAALKKGTHS